MAGGEAGPAPVVTADDGSEMVLVEAGAFVMGSGSGTAEESPPHVRRVGAFYIDRTEVTCLQYARYLQATSTEPPTDWSGSTVPVGREAHPITNITWFDAMRYALWAGKRLPTEAEWEKAARGADGRAFPWGDADDESRRNKDSGKLRPVGQYPAGASPGGCLDMSGNAWEWTADWFDPYPGSLARSVHFGQQYKVIRGGAGEYLYATDNTGTTTQRARLVPYGAHDFVGLRCVRDAPGAAPPYDARQWLKDAEARLTGYLREPSQLAYERQFKQMLATGRVPLSIQGPPVRQGHVRTGLPLPRGLLREVGGLHLTGAHDAIIPVQTGVLSRWPDDSIRWALLDFHASPGRAVYVNLTPAPAAAVQTEGVVVSRQAGRVVMAGPTIRIILSPEKLIEEIQSGSRTVITGVRLGLRGRFAGGDADLSPLPAEGITVEDSGPQYAQVRLEGFFADARGGRTAMKYDLRVGLPASAATVTLACTLVHHAARRLPWEAMDPNVILSDARLMFDTPAPIRECTLGTENGRVKLSLSDNQPVELLQSDDLKYEIRRGDAATGGGTRAPGQLAVATDGGPLALGVRHFWQNYPQALLATRQGFGVRLYAGGEPFVWEGGLAKTHEMTLDLAATELESAAQPLRAVIPPVWACGTEAAGAVMPRCAESIETLPYWECRRETAMRQWANGMPFGRRDFGDGYMGGPYKGKNAYVNLEYDVAWDFLMEYLRTGDLWFLETAEPMARHQADIDTENVAGFPWKHSPMHTTTVAELGHVFIRGLLLHHLLTGDRRSLETAVRIGNWIADNMERGSGVGNERQIGWSLYALTGLYDVTAEPRYLRAAETLTKRLVAGQSPSGKFDIRWDNRIAFFNGIAMNGMLTVYEITGDAALRDGIVKVAGRTLGMYPEYACRTLNAYCWMVEQRDDPRFLDNLERTWNSSMEFLLDRDCTTAETHAWKFPRFAARYGLFPVFRSKPEALPEASSWKSIRFTNPQVELYLRCGQAGSVVVIREGLARGQVRLYDMAGQRLHSFDLDRCDRIFEAVSLLLGASGVYRMVLAGPEVFGWQVQYDAATAVTVYDRAHKQIPCLLNRAYGCLREGAREVAMTFEAVGEGFHAAVLYDPNGSPVRAVRHFVDFEDPGRYELTLQAPVAGPREGWSLQLHALKVLRIEGMTPYWSNDPDEFFRPERIEAEP